MNILGINGFLQHVYQVCRLKVGSGSLMAPVCSSFVFVSRGSTKRSALSPEGDPSAPSVRDGNIILCRTLVLLYICAALRVWFMLEQPKGSIMQEHPAFRNFIKHVSLWRHYIAMRDYGAPTQKPTWLYSSLKCIESLSQFRPRQLPKIVEEEPKEMVIHYKDKEGKARIQGGKDLKSSENYPIWFGRSMSRMRSRYAAQVRKDAKKIVKRYLKHCKAVPINSKGSPKWIKWANLQPVLDCFL
ncbi:Putative rhamnose biosynthetic enzyme 1 [Durusdinium trenchii]|uniref:Rhamnose biosynthetic enzyme 1 n=1 Tax=Durusdinium trenchii TaxID=1381693 RepID=A0ABP0NAG0_9DINO